MAHKTKEQPWIPAMEDLPDPPLHLAHGDVEIRFSHKTPSDATRGFAAGYHFSVITSDGDEAGHINLRIGTTPHVTRVAGHIGYAIRPEYRGYHYAEKACRALALWARSFDMGFIITSDPDNHASLRSIENLGAEFLDEIAVPEDDPHFARGSTRKRRYFWRP